MDGWVPKDVLESARRTKSFKVHLVLGIGACVAAFVVWGFVGTFLSQWPWFVYALGTVAITLSFHYYVLICRPRLLFNFHVALYSALNAMLFLTWLCASSSTSGSAWFLYVLFGTAAPLAVHFTLNRYATSPHKWLYVHYVIAVVANVICFFAWMDTGKGFPWFIYTVTGTAFLVIIHNAIEFRSSLFSLHLRIFIDANITLFFSWAVLGMNFPWWIFIMALWAFLLLLHYRYNVWRTARNASLEGQPQRKSSVAADADGSATDSGDAIASSSSVAAVPSPAKPAARGMTRRDFIITIDDTLLGIPLANVPPVTAPIPSASSGTALSAAPLALEVTTSASGTQQQQPPPQQSPPHSPRQQTRHSTNPGVGNEDGEEEDDVDDTDEDNSDDATDDEGSNGDEPEGTGVHHDNAAVLALHPVPTMTAMHASRSSPPPGV